MCREHNGAPDNWIAGVDQLEDIRTLEKAVADGEIVPHYQPQVSARDGTLAGVEVLARWRHPDRGVLAPNSFLAGHESHAGLIQGINEAILRQACRDALQWPGIFIGVNVSPVQFSIPDFSGRLLDIAKAESFPPNRLEFEILETSYFANPAHMSEVLTGLRNRGVRVALDDFGTGYSSLAVLLELPLDKLKIDGGFVRQSGTLRSAAIIQAITALARAIGLTITAEGVETTQQAGFLKTAGCHYLQGYLFSKAVPAAELAEMYFPAAARSANG